MKYLRIVFTIIVLSTLLISCTKREEKHEIFIGIGHSVNPDIPTAVSESLKMLKEGIDNKTPNLIILTSTVDYDTERLVKELYKSTGNNAKIWGMTSCAGILTSDGFITSETGAMAIMGIYSPNMKFGVGYCDMNETKDPRKAGKIAINNAISDAGKPDEKPTIVLLTAPPGNEEYILTGIQEVLGKDIPIVGGSAADNTIEGNWKEFCNDSEFNNAVVVTAIYSDIPIGEAFQSRFVTTEKRGKVTEAEGRKILSIDNRPAALVYNDWNNNAFDDIIDKGGNILNRTALCSLAKPIKTKERIFYLSIHPEAILPDGSLTVFTRMNKGDDIILMNATKELLIDRTEFVAERAMSDAGLSKENVAGGLMIYCAGTMLAIGPDEVEKIIPKVKSKIGDKPFICPFTFGEQGYLGKDIGSVHGNLLNSMVVISNK